MHLFSKFLLGHLRLFSGIQNNLAGIESLKFQFLKNKS